jgi:hypothetical protein
MNIDEAVNIVEALAAGCDPVTGEEFDGSHILKQRDISDALSSLTEVVHVIRGALTTADEEGAVYSSVDPEFSDTNVYEAVQDQFGVAATGGPARFKNPGWFYIGPSVSSCPECGKTTEAFRMPYKTKAGVQYHYWALFCPSCNTLMAPSSLGEKRTQLYDSSELRPSDFSSAKGAGGSDVGGDPNE